MFSQTPSDSAGPSRPNIGELDLPLVEEAASRS